MVLSVDLLHFLNFTLSFGTSALLLHSLTLCRTSLLFHVGHIFCSGTYLLLGTLSLPSFLHVSHLPGFTITFIHLVFPLSHSSVGHHGLFSFCLS